MTAIEREMQRVGLWQAQPLRPKQSQFVEAFAGDTMTFAQWLQFVFLPSVREALRTDALPASSSVATKAAREFDGVPDTDDLLSLLADFDALINRPGNEKIDARALRSVSETALLTLNGRAHQAGLPDAIIEDPMAIEIVEKIDFDFDKFGRKGQEMALRSLAVDRCAIDYLTTHPDATVVALAEGFQTSFWRLNAALPDARFRWVSVDLPPVIGLRQRLLPASPRVTDIAQSALDYSWMDKVDRGNGVFITAEGLLMYLQPDEALDLIAQCANRFPGGQMFFDLPPTIVKKVARKGMRASKHYRVPPMPFSLSANQLADLANTTPGVRAVHDVPMPKGRGYFFGKVFPALWQFPPMKPFRGAYALLEFG